uniref:SXP/RAL-2 family protein Ani s 5-like cation-binding domain-containing protein n=1 Tax=Panagrolaimus sp. PS1159 TaxID=55785 RepID=A0AC35FUJ0_9BILA
MIKFTIFIAAAVFIGSSSAFWPFDGLNGERGGGRFPPPPPPRFPDSRESGEFEGAADFPRPPAPTFLRSVNSTEKRAYFKIEHNRNATKAEIQAQKDEWAANQTSEVQQAYNEYKAEKQEFIQNITAKGDKFAANLTQEVQAVYNQIKEVIQNQDISQSQECEQIREILSNTTKEIRRELKPLKRMVGKKCHGPRGPHGHGPRGSGEGSHEGGIGCGPRRGSGSEEEGPRGPPRRGSHSNEDSSGSGEGRPRPPHHPRPSGRPRPSGSPRPSGAPFTDIPLDGSTNAQFPTLQPSSTTSGGFFRNLFRF